MRRIKSRSIRSQVLLVQWGTTGVVLLFFLFGIFIKSLWSIPLPGVDNAFLKDVLLLLPLVVTGAVLSRALAIWLQHQISQPIEELLRLIKKVNRTSDYGLRVSHWAKNSNISEIDSLSEEFDQMLVVIQARDHEVHLANDNLQAIVEEKTQELMNTQAELMQTMKMSALGEMAAGIAHEINNPLAVISGKSFALLRDHQERELDPQKLERDLDKINQMAVRIGKIVKGLRAFSRDARDDPFQPESLQVIVNDTLELFTSRCRSKGVEFRLREVPDLKIECRATQIGQVLLNLLNNSLHEVQSLPEKWIELQARDLGDGYLRLSVTDSGKGIPPHLREKILQPFFTTKPVGQGTGLGLSISKGIVEIHGGLLEIDAQCPNTCFTVTLPLYQTKAPPWAA